MTKVIAKFLWDCGRMGSVEGMFTSTKEDIENIQGKYIYFGEILGKHSEIDGEIAEGDIKILTEDQEFIEKFEKIMGTGTISGHNPFDYYEREDEYYLHEKKQKKPENG